MFLFCRNVVEVAIAFSIIPPCLIHICTPTFPIYRRPTPCDFPFWADFGSSRAEKPPSSARGTLQATKLRVSPSHRHHHPPQEQRTPPEVPALLPAPLPAETAAQLWHLHHSPGKSSDISFRLDFFAIKMCVCV